MSSNVYKWEDPFRPIFEFYALAAWLMAALIAFMAIGSTHYPRSVFILFMTICLVMGIYRGRHALRLWRKQSSLQGTPLAKMSRDELAAVNPEPQTKMFLGYGFLWGQEQAQMAHTLLRHDPDRLTQVTDERMGQPWLHGLGKLDEEKILLPIDHTAGHVLLVGTTRAGKTRFLDIIIAQAVARGEAVIIWDPKGDRDLMNTAKLACDRSGEEDKFVYFHPAFPERSARIDPLRNFNRATELATRIAVLIPSETGADPFTSYSQMLLTNICEGLLIANIKPTIALLRRYVSSGVEEVVIKATTAWCNQHVPGWEEVYPDYKKRMKSKTLYDEALSYVNFYRGHVQDIKPSQALEGLFANFEHERTHAAKMTASLTPVLNMLTAGSLGPLLSPDPNDPVDQRPISDFARIIRNRQVCYVGLDSLSDNMVGSAIGSMFLSDMTAVSGDRYNYGVGDQPVTLVIDEAAELVSDKMIQLLNKAGGSKIRLIVATQTFADFAARVGSAEKARQVLGNLNNLIVLRTIDGATQEYIAENMPMTYVRHIEYGQAMGTSTDNALDFGHRLSETMKDVEAPLVTSQLMGVLPNLEFFAKISGGTVVKGRIPILEG